jgi:hypothetical protein
VTWRLNKCLLRKITLRLHGQDPGADRKSRRRVLRYVYVAWARSSGVGRESCPFLPAVKEPADLVSWRWIGFSGFQFWSAKQIKLFARNRAEQTLHIGPVLISVAKKPANRWSGRRFATEARHRADRGPYSIGDLFARLASKYLRHLY